MNENSKTIVKNTSVLLASQIATWIFSFLVTIILPRYIGPSAAGQFAISSAIWMILADVISFGSNTYVTKEVARNPERAGSLMGTVLVLRGLAYVISCSLLAVYLYFAKFPQETLYIILLGGIGQIFTQLITTSTAVLRGIERMEYISFSDIVSKAANVLMIFLVVGLNLGVYAVAIVAILVLIFSLLVQSRGLKQHVKIKLNFDRAQARSVFVGSMPFVLSGLIFTVYFQIDTIIMSSLVTTDVMGWYRTALNLSGTFLFLPVILSSAIFPAFARSYGNTGGSANKLLSKSIDLMFLFGIPIGFGLASVSTALISLLYGPAFAPASSVLSMMGFVLLFTYLTTVIGQYSVATERIHTWSIIMVIALVITIPLDFFLIPLCQQYFGNGGIGGVIAFLLTEFGMATAGILLLPRGMLQWSTVRVALSTLAAGLCMMGACWLARDQFVLVPIILGGLTYVGVIMLLRTVPREDMQILVDAVRSLGNRLRKRQVKSTSTGEA